jgi:hypothetical protein
MSALLLSAFKALGPGPTRREIATVASALRESGDEGVGRLLNDEENPQEWDRCCAIADEAGAYGFVALDLALACHNPRAFSACQGEDEHPVSTGGDLDAGRPAARARTAFRQERGAEEGSTSA